MSCLTEDITVWYLTGVESGYAGSPKFLDGIQGKSTKQVSVQLTQSDDGKDFNNTTAIQINVEPRYGAYISFGQFTGDIPPDDSLQIKSFVQDYFDSNLWEIHLG